MSTPFCDLMKQFDQNPAQTARGLKQLWEADPSAFVEQAVAAVREDPDSPASACLLRMLASEQMTLECITDPKRFTGSQSFEVAKRILAIDPNTDVRLLKLLVSNGIQAPVRTSWQATRVLDVAGRLTDGKRILAILANLVHHPDACIRSKATLLMGRINQNLRWVEDRLGDPDPRVRANAVESIWGVECVETRAVLLSASRDADHRVAANAAVGLHRFGDLVAVRLVRAMMAHQDVRFRAAGAWAAGETQDPRFVAMLAALKESDGSVRRNVLRSMVRLREYLGRFDQLPTLRLSADWDGNNMIDLEVRSASGGAMPKIPDTCFVITGRERALDVESVQYQHSPRARRYLINVDPPGRRPLTIAVYTKDGRGEQVIE